MAHNVNEAAKSLKNLKLIDYVPFHRIQDYFDKAKAYVCTSELEGFPNTFIQACLGGTPIISYCINPSNMIEEYDLGCFCHNDSERAVNFIKDLDSKKSNKFIDNLQKYVALKHNIYDTAENYLNLMKEGAGYARRAEFCDISKIHFLLILALVLICGIYVFMYSECFICPCFCVNGCNGILFL